MRLSKSHARMRMWRSARSEKRTNASKYSRPSTSMATRSAWAAAQQFSPARKREFGIAVFSRSILTPRVGPGVPASSPLGLWAGAHHRTLDPPALVPHLADGRVAGGEAVVRVVL